MSKVPLFYFFSSFSKTIGTKKGEDVDLFSLAEDYCQLHNIKEVSKFNYSFDSKRGYEFLTFHFCYCSTDLPLIKTKSLV